MRGEGVEGGDGVYRDCEEDGTEGGVGSDV